MTRKGKRSRERAASDSLEKMLETIKPFLPKRDLSEPEPSRKWISAQDGIRISHVHGRPS